MVLTSTKALAIGSDPTGFVRPRVDTQHQRLRVPEAGQGLEQELPTRDLASGIFEQKGREGVQLLDVFGGFLPAVDDLFAPAKAFPS